MKQLIMFVMLCALVMSANAQLRKPSTGGGTGGVGDTTFHWSKSGGPSLRDSLRFTNGVGILQSTSGQSIVTSFDSASAVVGSAAIVNGSLRTVDAASNFKAPLAIRADTSTRSINADTATYTRNFDWTIGLTTINPNSSLISLYVPGLRDTSKTGALYSESLDIPIAGSPKAYCNSNDTLKIDMGQTYVVPVHLTYLYKK